LGEEHPDHDPAAAAAAGHHDDDQPLGEEHPDHDPAAAAAAAAGHHDDDQPLGEEHPDHDPAAAAAGHHDDDQPLGEEHPDHGSLKLDEHRLLSLLRILSLPISDVFLTLAKEILIETQRTAAVASLHSMQHEVLEMTHLTHDS
jgi:hypothetical protein